MNANPFVILMFVLSLGAMLWEIKRLNLANVLYWMGSALLIGSILLKDA